MVRSRAAFLALSAARGSVRRLKAGEYEVPRDASTIDVVELLESGRVRQHTVLHPEGATIPSWPGSLEVVPPGAAPTRSCGWPTTRRSSSRSASRDRAWRATSSPTPTSSCAACPSRRCWAGWCNALRSRLTAERLAKAKTLGLDAHKLLTLASIIEREAVDPDERRLISAVFWNRLNLDMPLQADPTVQYAVAKERRTLTRADLLTDHPYNTYVRRGLPPGPIASPGLPAIEAALDPAPVKYLYFVARDDRRHTFSTTVGEHNQAVSRYRLSRR